MEWFNTNLPYLLAGISVGGQYALIAIGYTMVYGILRLINFAHGDIFMVAGLIMVYASASMPMYVSIPLVLVATVLLVVWHSSTRLFRGSVIQLQYWAQVQRE